MADPREHLRPLSTIPDSRGLTNNFSTLSLNGGQNYVGAQFTAKEQYFVLTSPLDPLISSLRPTSSYNRYDDVVEAFPDTYHWALTRSCEADGKAASSAKDTSLMPHAGPFARQLHADFPAWLQCPESELFWVTGNCGSGKSTLMKFLCSHSETSAHLRKWAGNKSLTILQHFLWRAGPPEANAFKGLLSSLLLQMLRVHNSLASQLATETDLDSQTGAAG